MKKFLSIILTAVMVFSIFSMVLNGATPAKLSVQGSQGRLAEEVTVSVNVGLHETLAAGGIKITYDPNLLSLVTHTPGDAIKDLLFEVNKETPGAIYLTFLSIEPINKAGELINLTFKILSDSQISIPIKVEIPEKTEFIDVDGNTISCEIKNGNVLVNLLKGDANNDNAVDNKDIDYVLDYVLKRNDAAKDFDLNGDKVCDISDIVILNEIISLAE